MIKEKFAIYEGFEKDELNLEITQKSSTLNINLKEEDLPVLIDVLSNHYRQKVGEIPFVEKQMAKGTISPRIGELELVMENRTVCPTCLRKPKVGKDQ